MFVEWMGYPNLVWESCELTAATDIPPLRKEADKKKKKAVVNRSSKSPFKDTNDWLE